MTTMEDIEPIYWYEPQRFECLICGKLVKKEGARVCPNHFLDILMHIGEGFYPEIMDFVVESCKMGACKRVNRVPDGVRIGKSRCFLVHPNKGNPIVFGYFIIDQIQILVKEGHEEISKTLKERGITPKSVGEASAEPDRGCGSREQVGACYILSKTDMEKVYDMGKGDISGAIVLFTTPIPYRGKHAKRFRGYALVNGEKVIDRAPIKKWFLLRESEE